MALERVLQKLGHHVVCADDGYWGLKAVQEQGPFDVVMLDICMPGIGGIELLERIGELSPHSTVLMMTGNASVETAVKSLKLGAFDYLSKPFDDIFRVCQDDIGRAFEASRHRRAATASADLVSSELSTGAFEGMIGDSPQMVRVYELVSAVAPTDASVLLQGETGVGKELIARAIHQRSARRDKPFVPLNCAALPADLLESELFGHEKGAFTGAHTAKRGLFEAAHNGTIFLDEIAEMPVALQAKLLRVLQEGEVRPVGSAHSRKVNVRVIAATHQNLRECARTHHFREDLYYRIAVVTIPVPPLRDRPGDVRLLAESFVKDFVPLRGGLKSLTQDTLTKLEGFNWEGNVRELRNVIESAVIFSRGECILPSDLPDYIQQAGRHVAVPGVHPDLIGMDFIEAKQRAVTDFETRYLKALLSKTEGNISQAAREAGMDRSNFRRLLKRHKVSYDSDQGFLPE